MPEEQKKSSNGEEQNNDPSIGRDKLQGRSVPVKVVDRRFWARKHESPDEIPTEGELFNEHRLVPTYVEELESKYQDVLMKFQAVSDAYRKMRDEQQQMMERLEKQRDHKVFEFKKMFFNRLLEVLDNMERAVSMIEQANPSDAILTGIHIMRDQLIRVLEQEGLVRIDPAKETYNPALAEVVEVVPTEDPNLDHCVCDVVQPGFMLDNLMLRPARVRVYRLRSDAREDEKASMNS